MRSANPTLQARSARSTRRWVALGAVSGLLAGGVASAPAAWLARAVTAASGDHLLLADARGSVWQGSAVAVLTGGPGSRSATTLPGRLSWTLGWADGAIELRAQQDCCLRGQPRLRLSAGWRPLSLELRADPSGPGGQQGAGPAVGQWPAGWLAGLGTPWNTLQLDGELRLSTPGLRLERVQGRWLAQGSAELDLAEVSSRVSTLPTLGSYRLRLDSAGEALNLVLGTVSGALRLSGQGQWTASGVHWRGEATAAPGAEAALDNLLNIIGRRQGARSFIAIG